MEDAERERIENSLEDELGFRWAPQMRHGHKALKLWNALVGTKAEIERLQSEVKGLKQLCREHVAARLCPEQKGGNDGEA